MSTVTLYKEVREGVGVKCYRVILAGSRVNTLICIMVLGLLAAMVIMTGLHQNYNFAELHAGFSTIYIPAEPAPPPH